MISAAVPITFGPGGDFRLHVLAAGTPTSQTIAGNDSSAVGVIERRQLRRVTPSVIGGGPDRRR